LVGWLVGRLVGWSVGWLVGWLIGWLVGWSVGWLVGWLVGRLVGVHRDALVRPCIQVGEGEKLVRALFSVAREMQPSVIFIGLHPLHIDSYTYGWLSSRVVSVLNSGAVRPGFKSQPLRCRVTVLGKLFTPIVHQVAKLVAARLRVAKVTAGLAESRGSLPPGL